MSSSSSSEEEGDAAWKAAISSAAEVASSYINGLSAAEYSNPSKIQQLPKHYQIKAQKLLDDIIGKSLEIVQNQIDDEPVVNEDEGVRLFKNAPPGIVFDHVEERAPRRRPRILPGQNIDEKSKKFKRQIRSVAVDENDIVSEARARSQRALSRLEAKDAAAKEKRKELHSSKKLGEKDGYLLLPEKCSIKSYTHDDDDDTIFLICHTLPALFALVFVQWCRDSQTNKCRQIFTCNFPWFLLS